MMINRLKYSIAAGCLTALSATSSAWADTTYFNANQTYRGLSDSPFWTGSAAMSAGNFRVENCEDGFLNSLGVTGRGGKVQGPSASTDSVDSDGNHVLDGQGSSGSSYLVQPNANGKSKAVFTFDSHALGHLPTFAGLVWTDGRPDAVVTFKAYDASGHIVGRITTRLGDSSSSGTTAEDRFLGASYSRGIARIVVTASLGDFEIDHLQYGFAAFAMSAVPAPPSLALGAVGLLGAGLARRRMMRALG